MVRVLLVHQPVDGGVGRHIADLAAGLAGAGYEVITCSPSEAAEDSVSAHLKLEMRRSITPASDFSSVSRFRSIVRSVKPDIVHAHSSKAGVIARLANTFSTRTPLIYTPHGFAFAGFFERRAEHTAYRAVERALAPLCRRVLCVCDFEGGLARGLGRPERVRVVHNGVDTPRSGSVDDRMLALRSKGPVICTIGQFRRGKGLETLLDAVPVVSASIPEVQFAIWGDGPELAALYARAQARSGAGSVHFLGATTDPVAALRGASAFAMPSWAEAFPYVVLEAMSVGCPIVATDVGGVAEALGGGMAGVLVDPRDPKRLGSALIELLVDRGRAAALGIKARERVEECYSVDGMVRGIRSVYDEVIH